LIFGRNFGNGLCQGLADLSLEYLIINPEDPVFSFCPQDLKCDFYLSCDQKADG
jgi:hypothetical protein